MSETVLNLPIHYQNWVIILFLSFFVIFVTAYIRSNNWISSLHEHFSKSLTTSISYKKRTAEEQQSRILMTLFSVGIVILYISIYAANYVAIDLRIYLKLILLTLIFLLIKEQLALIIGYIFGITESIKLAAEQYFNIVFLFSTILYPLLILRCFLFANINLQIPDAVALFSGIISILLIIIMIFQIFHKNILDSLHILLYLCTLEFLPYFGMFFALRWVIYG